MYTNWPFTAKQTHIPFTCLSSARGGFLQKLTSEYTVQTDLFSHSISEGQVFWEENLSGPQHQHRQEEIEEKQKSTEPQLKCFQVRLQKGGFFSFLLDSSCQCA